MSNARKGATYLSPKEVKLKQPSYSPFRAIVLILLALSVLFASFPLMSRDTGRESVKAEAFRFPLTDCGDGIGVFMGEGAWSNRIHESFPGGDKTRRLLAHEMFNNNISFHTYYGETNPDKNQRDGGVLDDKRKGNPERKTIEENGVTKDYRVTDNDDGSEGGVASLNRVYSARNVPNCALSGPTLAIANGSMALSNTWLTILSAVTSSIFTGKVICETPQEGAAVFDKDLCLIDLLFITGGDGTDKNKGLIGNLTSGIYYPLLVLVALFVAVWAAINGLWKRKFRETFFGLAWSVMAVIVGLAFLTNPSLLAKAPAVISNTLAGCVMSAFSGGGCLSSGDPVEITPTDGNASAKVCNASFEGVPDKERLSMITGSMTCSIWKAFILETYSQAHFGTSFTQLNVYGDTYGNELVKRAKSDPTYFCVDMRAAKPINEMRRNTLETRGDVVCNLALYQLSLKGDINPASNPVNEYQSGTATIKTNWYGLVDVMSASDTSWGNWGASFSSALGKLMSAGIAGFATFMGSIVIFVVALYAMVYYVAAIFLMVFAPLFFLIGVHPGKGRDILKGYGEMVLSNILKYFASAVFLVVTLGIFGAVLGASTGPGTTLIMVLILTVALLMYRKEIVDLLGTVNMGGTKFGQETAGRFTQKFGRNAKRMVSITTGSAIGGALAGGKSGAWHGITEGVGRELKRDGGLLGTLGAGAGRGAEVAGAHNRQKLSAEVGEQRAEAHEAEEVKNEKKEEATTAGKELKELVDTVNKLAQTMVEAQEKAKASDPKAILSEWKGSGNADKAAFSQFQTANDEIALLDRKLSSPAATAEQKVVWNRERVQQQQKSDRLQGMLTERGSFDELKTAFNEETQPHREAVAEFRNAKAQRDQLMGSYDEKVNAANAANEAYREAAAVAATKQTLAHETEKSLTELRANQVLHTRRAEKLKGEAAEAAAVAGDARGQEIQGKTSITMQETQVANYDGPASVQETKRVIHEPRPDDRPPSNEPSAGPRGGGLPTGGLPTAPPPQSPPAPAPAQAPPPPAPAPVDKPRQESGDTGLPTDSNRPAGGGLPRRPLPPRNPNDSNSPSNPMDEL